MLTNNRKYNYIGQITLRTNYTLKLERLSDEDIDPWLFLVLDKNGMERYTFFYLAEKAKDTICEKPFNILLSFIMDDMKKIIQVGKTYDVWRGENLIGSLLITEIVE